jgi:hypothetical protein
MRFATRVRTPTVMMLLPLGVAILQRRLYDLPLALNRSLTYGADGVRVRCTHRMRVGTGGVRDAGGPTARGCPSGAIAAPSRHCPPASPQSREIGGQRRGRRSLTCAFPGVSDGTRTRDIRDHNQVLYQLSYTHHGSPTPPRRPGEQRKCTCSQAVLSSGPMPVSEPPNSWARTLASADAGPGEGTNTAAR